MFQNKTNNGIILGLILSSFLIPFQNCSQISAVDLSPVGSALVVAPTAEIPTTETPPPYTPPTTEETLKTMKPALAVRGMSCLMCHAEVRANIITDFGYGTSAYLGGDKHFTDDDSWFNNLAGAWQSARKIRGTVYVPNAQVTARAQATLGNRFSDQPMVSLVELMTTPMNSNYERWSEFLTANEAQSEMALKVVPDEGQNRVIAKRNIEIRAPSESEIRELAPSLWTDAVSLSGVARLGSNATVQLFQHGSGTAKYLSNSEEDILECSQADIVVRGTLLLRRLKVNAAGGCRLYVSGSVFIEEGITYVGSGENQNLQITSSSAIVMGIDLKALKKRLIDQRRGLNLVAREYTALANQVILEATNIGNLKDARGGTNYEPAGQTDFSAILLNAPIVHSRYLGQVTGTIIAEAALFSLGEFHFAFDNVFTKVSVLPKLSRSILSVE